jgi:membrane fusion protein, copper/silver efflux system
MTRFQIAAISLLAALLAGAGFYIGRSTGHSADTVAPATTSGQKTVLYWHDPMVPGPRFDKPGKSPFMDMQLVPVYADSGSADSSAQGGVRITAAVQQNLGIRTAKVTRADVSSSFDAVGAVQFDERLTVAVQSRVAGYVERLAVRAPMESVRKGQALATIFAPEWLAPQNELLALKRAGVSAELVAAARERLRAMSVPDTLVRQSEAAGSAQARFTLSAPASGVVAELGVREGAAITAGMTLFRIAGLEKVWAVAEIPEAQASFLTAGQRVKATVQADESLSFSGALKELIPEVNTNSRTLKARFEVDNKGGRLIPGMLLRLQVAGPTASRLVVPSEAVIRTGKRAVVIVRNANGTFQPRDVMLGADLGDRTEVVQGVSEGEEVVASGQFLIDSEASLRSALGMMAPPSAFPPATPPTALPASSPAAAPDMGKVHSGQGKIESIEPDAITISHGPVPSLKWPEMTMGFGRPDPKSFPDLKPGDSVRFEFRQGGAQGYELVSVQKVSGAKP